MTDKASTYTMSAYAPGLAGDNSMKSIDKLMAAANQPLYNATEVAKYIGVNYATLHSWLRPVQFETDTGIAHKPLIEADGQGLTGLSFLNLVEAYVVKALRSAHRVPLGDIRSAVEYAQRTMQIERLLVDERLKVGAQGVFLEHLGKLINLGRAGQFAMEKVLAAHLRRIDFEQGLAIRLRPQWGNLPDDGIVISPFVAFGKPVVSRLAISTQIIVERFDMGDTEEELARDYGIKVEEVEEAILYEYAA